MLNTIYVLLCAAFLYYLPAGQTFNLNFDIDKRLQESINLNDSPVLQNRYIPNDFYLAYQNEIPNVDAFENNKHEKQRHVRKYISRRFNVSPNLRRNQNEKFGNRLLNNASVRPILPSTFTMKNENKTHNTEEHGKSIGVKESFNNDHHFLPLLIQNQMDTNNMNQGFLIDNNHSDLKYNIIPHIQKKLDNNDITKSLDKFTMVRRKTHLHPQIQTFKDADRASTSESHKNDSINRVRKETNRDINEHKADIKKNVVGNYIKQKLPIDKKMLAHIDGVSTSIVALKKANTNLLNKKNAEDKSFVRDDNELRRSYGSILKNYNTFKEVRGREPNNNYKIRRTLDLRILEPSEAERNLVETENELYKNLNISQNEYKNSFETGSQNQVMARIFEDEEAFNALRKQTELLHRLAEKLEKEETLRTKSNRALLTAEFDNILNDVQSRVKKNTTKDEDFNKRIEGSTQYIKKVIPTMKSIIDETEVKKALMNDPLVMRIIKMAGKKRDKYFENLNTSTKTFQANHRRRVASMAKGNEMEQRVKLQGSRTF